MIDAPGPGAAGLARATARLAAVDEAADPRRAAELWERMAHELRLAGQGEESFAALDRALRLLAGAGAGDAAERAALRERYAALLLDHGRYGIAVTMAEAAIADGGDRAVLARASSTLGLGKAALGATGEGLELLRAAVRDSDDRAAAVAALADAVARLGRPEDALALLRSRPERPGGARPSLLEADLLLALGRPDDAERALAGAPGSLREARLRARLAVLRGDWSAAGRRLDAFAARCDVTPAPQWLEPLHGMRALTALHGDRVGEARELVAAGLTALQGTDDGTRQLRLVWIGLRAEAEAAARAVAAGEAFDPWTLRGLETELAYAEGAAARWAEAAPTAAVARAELGRVAGLLGAASPDPAAWLAPARTFTRLGLAWPAAYARVRAGEALLATGAEAEARRVLAAARSAARQLGARPLLEAIEALDARRTAVARAH